MGMLKNMTNLFAKITARGDAMDEPYYQIAENNLVYAVGKQLQASSSEDGHGRDSDHVNIAVSGGCLKISQGVLYKTGVFYLLENTRLVKFIPNQIWEPSCVFFISSLVRISMTSSRAFSRLFVHSQFVYIIQIVYLMERKIHSCLKI